MNNDELEKLKTLYNSQSIINKELALDTAAAVGLFKPFFLWAYFDKPFLTNDITGRKYKNVCFSKYAALEASFNAFRVGFAKFRIFINLKFKTTSGLFKDKKTELKGFQFFIEAEELTRIYLNYCGTEKGRRDLNALTINKLNESVAKAINCGDYTRFFDLVKDIEVRPLCLLSAAAEEEAKRRLNKYVEAQAETIEEEFRRLTRPENIKLPF